MTNTTAVTNTTAIKGSAAIQAAAAITGTAPRKIQSTSLDNHRFTTKYDKRGRRKLTSYERECWADPTITGLHKNGWGDSYGVDSFLDDTAIMSIHAFNRAPRGVGDCVVLHMRDNPDLFPLYRVVSFTRCWDPRDMWFATLVAIAWPSEAALTDYKESTHDLRKSLTRILP